MQDLDKTLFTQSAGGELGNSSPPQKEEKVAVEDDFTGFWFGGKHSSEYNILRVSEGSRYSEELLPGIMDKAIKVPGGDGYYYYGSEFGQKRINVSFAFDSVTERDYRDLQRWLGTKKVQKLIFDEKPYKVYYAKVSNSITMRTICFYQQDQRIYKGEGQIQFVCYYPFARTPENKKFLVNYDDKNKSQWAAASGMKEDNSQGSYDTWSENGIKLYNPGDLETDFKLKIEAAKLTSLTGIKSFGIMNDANKQLYISFPITMKGNDRQIVIDTSTNLIAGLDANGLETGNLYNEYIKKGNFFKIPLDESQMQVPVECTIEYDYLYY